MQYHQFSKWFLVSREIPGMLCWLPTMDRTPPPFRYQQKIFWSQFDDASGPLFENRTFSRPNSFLLDNGTVSFKMGRVVSLSVPCTYHYLLLQHFENSTTVESTHLMFLLIIKDMFYIPAFSTNLSTVLLVGMACFCWIYSLPIAI